MQGKGPRMVSRVQFCKTHVVNEALLFIKEFIALQLRYNYHIALNFFRGF